MLLEPYTDQVNFLLSICNVVGGSLKKFVSEFSKGKFMFDEKFTI